MNTIEVSGQTSLINIPSEWDELRADQIKNILQLAVGFNTGEMDYNKFVVRCFYLIADIKRSWISVVRERLLSPDRRQQKFENTFLKGEQLTKFLFKPVTKKTKDKPREFYYDTVINFLPKFKAGGKLFFGPEDLLSDLTFGEFIDGIEAMNEYVTSREPEALDKFIVTLYRPSKNGKKRIARDESSDIDYSRRLRKTDPAIKLGIFLWFTTCIKYIKSEDIIVGGKQLNLSVLFPKSKEDENEEQEEPIRHVGLGWTSVLYGIAKEGLFGPIDKTNDTNLFKVLLFMYDSHLINLKNKPKAK